MTFTTTSTPTFRVYWINFQYYSSESFVSVDEALAYIKAKGFEGRVDGAEGEIIASWSVFGGTRYW